MEYEIFSLNNSILRSFTILPKIATADLNSRFEGEGITSAFVVSIWYKNAHRPFSTCQYYFGNKLSGCYEISQEMKYQEQSSMSSSSLVPLKNVPNSSGQNFPLLLHISDLLVLCNKKEKTIFSCIKVIY